MQSDIEDDLAAGTAAEQRFELWRRRSGIVLAPLAFFLAWQATTELAMPAHRLAAVLAGVVALWITEAIPMAMTAFLGVAATVVLQVAPPTAAFAPFADPLIFLFIGTFMLAQAIFVHGLDRRFALAMLSLRLIGRSPARILAAYATVTCLISMWISNTATTAMMFPIGVSLLHVLEQQGPKRIGPRYGAALLLSAAFASSVGGLATPVGTPPNLIGVGFIRRELGIALPFFSWMAVGLPISLVMLVAMLAILIWGGTRDAVAVEASADFLRAERDALGPWTRAQVNTMIAFVTTVALWVLPGFIALFVGQDHWLYRNWSQMLPEPVVALLGAGLLFVLPVDLRRHHFTLTWAEAVKIDWWIVFLYGGGIALGTLSFQTGLADAMGKGLTSMFGVQGQFGLLVLSTAVATVLSETTSNTAAANMVVPVVIAFARSSGVDPLIPALGATLGASLGFILPVSTPTNAIVFGSGRIPVTFMMRHGAMLDIVGIATIIALLTILGPFVHG